MINKQFKKLREGIEEKAESAIKKITAGFMEVLAALKAAQSSPAVLKQFENLYKEVLQLNRSLAEDLRALMKIHDKSAEELNRLRLENQRLETLYTSGIYFSTQIEKNSLLQTAMDIVEKALQADAGYIVLVDENGQPTLTVGHNLDDDGREKARDMSTTVIRSTIRQSQPTQVDDTRRDLSLSRQSSILQLDIQSVLCVPLVLDGKVSGAVYLDRRQQARPFSEADLTFLLSFSQQIVRGLKISATVNALQEKLLADAAMTFEELRRQFHCPQIIGSSSRLFEVLRMASRIAPTDVSVLILGESGTGKELLARAIHENSGRPQNLFAGINCGAIPRDLLESELFGYEKGAFTGAAKEKPGKLEAASGGTVFLDEIAEMDVHLQAKLLRVLQEKEVERLGSVKTRKIDIRIVAASNQPIARLVEQGKFREDLYYRLKVIVLTLPPLRERREDIVELAEYFVAKHHRGKPAMSISGPAAQILRNYDWPGNIRELENAIQRCVVLARGPQIEVEDLPPEITKSVGDVAIDGGGSLWEAEQAFRRQYVLNVLKTAESKAEAARKLGINRTYLYKMMEELGIDR